MNICKFYCVRFIMLRSRHIFIEYSLHHIDEHSAVELARHIISEDLFIPPERLALESVREECVDG